MWDASHLKSVSSWQRLWMCNTSIWILRLRCIQKSSFPWVFLDHISQVYPHRKLKTFSSIIRFDPKQNSAIKVFPTILQNFIIKYLVYSDYIQLPISKNDLSRIFLSFCSFSSFSRSQLTVQPKSTKIIFLIILTISKICRFIL